MMSSTELVRELLEQLGPTIVAALTNTRDRTLPAKWIIKDGPEAPAAALARLQAAYQAWSTVAKVHGEEIARAWFTGANPRLHDQTPYIAIREHRCTEVLAAAEEFIDR